MAKAATLFGQKASPEKADPRSCFPSALLSPCSLWLNHFWPLGLRHSLVTRRAAHFSGFGTTGGASQRVGHWSLVIRMRSLILRLLALLLILPTVSLAQSDPLIQAR